jgi:hypothetical protein
MGLWVGQGSTANATELVVRDTQPRQTDGTLGRGVQSEDASNVVIQRSLVAANHEAGLLALSSSLSLDQVVVRDTLPPGQDGLTGGGGLYYRVESTGTVDRTALTNNRGVGLDVSGGSTVQVSDTLVRGGLPDVAGLHGLGIVVEGQSQTTIERTSVVGNRVAGLLVIESTIDGRRLAIRDTQGRDSDGLFGRGISIQAQSMAVLRQAVVARNQDVGFEVIEANATIEDSVVRDTRERVVDEQGGLGIYIEDATAEVHRAIVGECRLVGVDIIGSTADLNHVVVRDTAVAAVDGRYGDGVLAREQASASLTRVVVEASARVGVFFHAAGGLLDESLIRGNQLAVLLEDGADPMIGKGTVLQDNLDDRVVTGGGLEPSGRLQRLPPPPPSPESTP